MNTALLIRLDKPTRRQLEMIARENDRSMAATVRQLVREAAREIERQRPPKPAQREPFVEVRDAEAG